MLKKVLLFICLFGASNVMAQTFDVSLVIVPGAYALPKKTILDNFKIVQKQYKQELHIKLRINKVRVKRENPNIVWTLDLQSQKRRIDSWLKYFQRRNDFTPLRLVILPPISHSDGIYFILGASLGVCSFDNGNAISEVNASTIFSKWHFANSVAHELGHLLGAYHDDSDPPSAMNPNSLFYVKDAILRFSRQSKREIRGCIHGI